MTNTEKSGVRAFLNKKGITLSPKVYFIDATVLKIVPIRSVANRPSAIAPIASIK